MKIAGFLSKLYDLGIKISVVDNKLRIQSTKEKISENLIEEIKLNKNEIINYLNGKATKNIYIAIPQSEYKAYYKLSSAQKRLYLLQQMDLESTAYNMPYFIPIGYEIDKSKVEDVFQELILRHESFRTSFEVKGEIPVQRIHEDVQLKVEEFAIEKEEEEHIRDQFLRAFDLSKAPLLRIAILNIKGEGRLLKLDMHHIISDGVSQSILEEEFQQFYHGETLPKLKLQYKDYSEWQGSAEHRARVEEQALYWERQFEVEIPVLNLPTDYPRPIIQSYEGANVNFALSIEETKQLRNLVQENGLTLYMVILSAFTILLSRLSGQDDIIIGTPIAGRNHPDLERIVGMFVNTLALRHRVEGVDTLRGFVGKVKQTTLEAFEHQDYQFEDLVERVSITRDTSRNPLFDVMFNLLNHGESAGDPSELNPPKLVHTPGVSKFDLTLTAVDSGEQMLFILNY